MFHPGETHTLVVTASNVNSDNVINNLVVSSSDPNVVAVSATADPLTFQLTFLSVGHVDLTATATNSDGNTVTGSLPVDSVAEAVSGLTLTITD